MKKLRIAVICGGDSSEMEVSLRSGAAVFESLDRTKYDPMIVELSKNGWYALPERVGVDKNDFSVDGVRFDYALLMIHGTPGENGVLQGYFDLLGIPYSSPGVETSAVTFNKVLTKLVISSIGEVGLAREISLDRDEKYDTAEIVRSLGLPLFVKPNASGSSCGVSKVKCEQDLHAAIDGAFMESDQVLMEEYIEGVEISQGVMICGDTEYVLPATELVSENEFFDYQAKYTPGMTHEITPARIEKSVADLVSRITLQAYKRLHCRGVVRMDYIIKGGVPYFIEVNTIPGMSKQSIIPQQWAAVGLTMGAGLDLIISSTKDDKREVKNK
ncbi:MAG: D-alanine--D-alanine ligase family protein [Mucinivorans sp.]